MLGKYKNIIIIIVVIALGLIAYSIFRPDPEVKKLLETTQRQDSAQVLGDDITKAINQIQSLKLDRAVLDDPVLKNLVDHSEPIIPEPIGRKNPFAPIGSNSGGSSEIKNSATTTKTTSPAGLKTN